MDEQRPGLVKVKISGAATLDDGAIMRCIAQQIAMNTGMIVQEWHCLSPKMPEPDHIIET